MKIDARIDEINVPKQARKNKTRYNKDSRWKKKRRSKFLVTTGLYGTLTKNPSSLADLEIIAAAAAGEISNRGKNEGGVGEGGILHYRRNSFLSFTPSSSFACRLPGRSSEKYLSFAVNQSGSISGTTRHPLFIIPRCSFLPCVFPWSAQTNAPGLSIPPPPDCFFNFIFLSSHFFLG